MGKIDDARQVLTDLTDQVDGLKRERQALLSERIQLEERQAAGDNSPEALARLDLLAAAIERLDAQIPRGPYRPGEMRPRLQHELEKAERELDEVRSARWRLAYRLRELDEDQQRGIGLLDQAQSAAATLLQVAPALGWPPGLDERALRGWLARLRQRARSWAMLPKMRKDLAAYGDDPDPDWRPPGAPLDEEAERTLTRQHQPRLDLSPGMRRWASIAQRIDGELQELAASGQPSTAR